jgi:hypothetical protein
MQVVHFVPLFLPIAASIRIALALFHVLPGVGYEELSFSAITILTAYLAFLMRSCCRNPSISLIAVSGLIYILSTTIRAIFPVRQELKACYHTSLTPWVDRLIALFGELALGLQIAFVIATIAHLSKLPYAKVLFSALMGVIFLAEIVCYAACLTHPSLHNVEYLLWSLVVITALLVSILAQQRIQSPDLRNLCTCMLIVCLLVCYFFGFHLELYPRSMQANNNMFSCHTAPPQVWTDYFTNYAYPYFVVFAAISGSLTILTQQIRRFDENATSWLH